MQYGNQFAKRSLWAVALLVLSACGGGEEQQSLGVTETEVIIGTHQDLSGPIVAWGASVRNGMVMATDEINAAGGVHGRTIRLLVEDNGYDPQKAVLAARKLITRDKVFAIVGALGTPTSMATLDLVLGRGVLHLFPFTAAEGTYEPFHPLKFASNVPYKDSIRVGVRYFVQELGLRRAAILYQDDDFGLDVRRGAEAELRRFGLEPVAITTYKRGATDFSAQAARMRNAGADFLVLGTIIRETIGVLRSARTLGWDVPAVCSQACYTPEVHDLGGEVVEGLYATGQVPVPYADNPNPHVREWYRLYEERFNLKPNVQALTGYTIMKLFAAGMEATGPDLTIENYARALEAMPAWVDEKLGGVPTDYTAEDHLGINKALLARIQGGQWRILFDGIEVNPE